MTRLHIQVNQTIQFYRGQQGGAAPQRLFLSGGASTMPYTAQFFAEKLNLPVEYFNPLRNVQIDPGVDLEELAKIGHQMGELVGLGLRNLAHCPVELNLMPKSALQGQTFNARKPYFIAVMGCLVAILFAFGFFYDRIAKDKQAAKEKLVAQLSPLQSTQQKLEQQLKKVTVAQGEAMQLASWLEARDQWGSMLMHLRDIMIRVEKSGKTQFKTDTGIWIEKISTDCSGTDAVAATGTNAPQTAAPVRLRTGQVVRRPTSRVSQTANVSGVVPVCNFLNVICRGVDLSHVAPNANITFAYKLDEELKASSLFATNTGVIGNLIADDRTFKAKTFTVDVVLVPKKPLKL
jgi:hypothetical protein